MCFLGRSGGKQKCNICILLCLSFTGWVSGCWADMLEKQGVSSVGRAAALQTGETEAQQVR